MKILEILLPKGTSDRSLPLHAKQQIDVLQHRMNLYVDKILDPATSPAGKEFLKTRLRTDYSDLKHLIPEMMAEDETPDQFEVYDRQTKKVVGGPYSSLKRASRAADKKDLAYGAIRYGYRRIAKPVLSEAVHKLPLTLKDFELVKTLMDNPIPAAIAPIYIHRIIEDDELNDQIKSIEDTDPGRDIRPLIYEWFVRVMPDQLYRFRDGGDTSRQNGALSPLHGYDPHMYKGTSDPITGGAYGSK